MNSRHYYFTCHPRYIEKKAQELVSFLAGTNSYHYYRPQDIARIVYATGLSRPNHVRTVALIAQIVAKELLWRNSQWRKDFVDELVDLSLSKFVTSWTDEIDRLSEVSEADTRTYENSETSSDEDDLLFQASNPRMDEWTYSMLYDEECSQPGDDHVAPTSRLKPQVLAPRSSPTPSAVYEMEDPNFGIDDAEDVNTPLLVATVILGDLFAMGLVPIQTMRASALYIAENLLNANDGHLLYMLLTRAASHVAPPLGVPFLQQCRTCVVKNQNLMEANGYHNVQGILKAIDELIDHELNYSVEAKIAVYSDLACHRWDPSMSADTSWGF